MTRSTASRVSGRTRPLPLTTRETVIGETPARLATSRTVAVTGPSAATRRGTRNTSQLAGYSTARVGVARPLRCSDLTRPDAQWYRYHSPDGVVRHGAGDSYTRAEGAGSFGGSKGRRRGSERQPGATRSVWRCPPTA